MLVINLLPWRERQIQKQKRKFVVLSLGLILVVIFAFVLMAQIIFLKTVEKEHVALTLQPIQAQNKLVRQAITKIINQTQVLSKQLHIGQALQKNHEVMNQFLTMLVTAIPASVALFEVDREQKRIYLKGFALNENAVTECLEKLKHAIPKQKIILHEITQNNVQQRVKKFIVQIN